jgi:hypothetical protein
MNQLRHMAIKHLSYPPFGPIKRINLGQTYGVVDWMSTGYAELILRPKPLSPQEFQYLGLSAALKLSQEARRPHLQLESPWLYYGTAQSPESSGLSAGLVRVIHNVVQNEMARDQRASLPIVNRVIVARTSGASEWLISAYSELAKRKEDITIGEARLLGLTTTAHLCAIRELTNDPYKIQYDISPYERIRKVFQRELETAGEKEKHHHWSEPVPRPKKRPTPRRRVGPSAMYYYHYDDNDTGDETSSEEDTSIEFARYTRTHRHSQWEWVWVREELEDIDER